MGVITGAYPLASVAMSNLTGNLTGLSIVFGLLSAIRFIRDFG